METNHQMTLPPADNPLVRMSFDAHLTTKDRFRQRCAKLETTMAERLRELMENDLAEQDAQREAT